VFLVCLLGAVTCTPCDTGSFSGLGASACTPCNNGGLLVAVVEERIAVAGTYANVQGLGQCLVCPAGTYSLAGKQLGTGLARNRNRKAAFLISNADCRR
jgi:hypothetical protein